MQHSIPQSQGSVPPLGQWTAIGSVPSSECEFINIALEKLRFAP
jgi:hypothetical protein